ncbi:transposase [Streptomyces sp. NPDC056716]|uniref:transposase n=1 Tax=unclassified Streptomyces TaxID=2593676 RepID=UPI003682F52A
MCGPTLMPRHARPTDHQWDRIQPLPPSRAGRRGRLWADHRRMVEAIVYPYRTGTPWRGAPIPLALIAERQAQVCGARWSPDLDLTARKVAPCPCPSRSCGRSRRAGRSRQRRSRPPGSEAPELMAATGVRRVRLHDARHACPSWTADRPWSTALVRKRRTAALETVKRGPEGPL